MSFSYMCSTVYMRTPHTRSLYLSLWVIPGPSLFFSSCARYEKTAHLAFLNLSPRLIIVCSTSTSSVLSNFDLLLVSIEYLYFLTCASSPLIRPTLNAHIIFELPAPCANHFVHHSSLTVVKPCISLQHRYAL